MFALATVAALGTVAWRQSALSDLRTENQRLRDHTAAAEQMTRQNGDIARLRAENQELQTLRDEIRDLHKLRNEVRQLRDRAKGLPGVRTENKRLKVVASQNAAKSAEPKAPSPTTLDQVSYVGRDTPEGTLQSFLWAVRQENTKAFRNCLTPERRKETESLSEDQIRSKMREMKSQFKGFQIAAKKEISAEEVLLGLQFFVEDQQEPGTGALVFKRIAYEWKLDVTP
jgi:hypothetical protein